jgi:hypothetical protein
MFSEVITVSDGAVPRSYTAVSRSGMDTIRRETTAGTPSTANSTMTIRHTLDGKNQSKPNRHLVAFQYTEIDATGKAQVVTVHVVINRAKGATDATVIKLATALGEFLTTADTVSSLLIGGN